MRLVVGDTQNERIGGGSSEDRQITEVGDLLAIIEMSQDCGLLDPFKLQAAILDKRERLKHWHPDLFG